MANKVKEFNYKSVGVSIYDDNTFYISSNSYYEYNCTDLIGPIKIETTDVEKTAIALIDMIFTSTRGYVRCELNKLL